MGYLQLAFLACSVFLSSCSRDKPATADAAPTGGVHSDLSNFDSGPGSIPSTIYLVVTGGANAGTYQAEVGQGGCTAGSGGPNSWIQQYALNSSDPKTLSSMQINAPDVQRGAEGTTRFLLSASFGPLHNPSEYRIDTRAEGSKNGSGKVTVDDRKDEATIRFSGVTTAGVKLEGRVDCRSIIRR
jgi:hypothetical protein